MATARKTPPAKKAPARKTVPAKKAATEKKKRATPSHKAVPKLLPVEELTPQQRTDLEAASKIVRESGLEPRQQLFVVEFAKDANGAQAVIRAGYGVTNMDSAAAQASRLLRDVKVKAVVDAVLNDRVERGVADGDAVVAAWVAQSQADANSLTQYRRVACRYCYGKGFKYQYTPAEMEDARKKHEEEWKRRILKAKAAKVEGAEDLPIPPFDEKGGLGYRGNRDPHPECPECWGEGVGRPFFADTRKIPEADRVLFAGVKQGKEGIEILMHDAEGARDKLARHYGLYKPEKGDTLIVPVSTDVLDDIYRKGVEESEARKQELLGRGERVRADVVKNR